MTETTFSITITILGAIIGLSCIAYLFFINTQAYNDRVEACVKLGYEDIGEARPMSIYGTCADSNDDLHYVKWTCDSGFINSVCTAKNIKQGDVTGVLK